MEVLHIHSTGGIFSDLQVGLCRAKKICDVLIVDFQERALAKHLLRSREHFVDVLFGAKKWVYHGHATGSMLRGQKPVAAPVESAAVLFAQTGGQTPVGSGHFSANHTKRLCELFNISPTFITCLMVHY